MEKWQAKLKEGDPEAAWDLFIERYHRLILATIRRTVQGADSASDVFTYVCEQLSLDSLARLQRYVEGARRGRFSTWLVAVVHNLTVDWLRHRDGRRRVKTPAGLSPIQRQIFFHVFVEQRSHAETYELVRLAISDRLSFGIFLRELAQTYRLVEAAGPAGVMRYLTGLADSAHSEESTSERLIAREELRRELARAFESLPADERLGVQLFIVEELPAADVARTLGWPNAKAVYNRVYRALASMRRVLEQKGIARGDL